MILSHLKEPVRTTILQDANVAASVCFVGDGIDEINIISALMAKQMGAGFCAGTQSGIFEHLEFMIEKLGIDWY